MKLRVTAGPASSRAALPVCVRESESNYENDGVNYVSKNLYKLLVLF